MEQCLKNLHFNLRRRLARRLITYVVASSMYLRFLCFCFKTDLHTSSCLAHIINLAAQALISAYSKSPHYNPADPDNHLNFGESGYRDEVGLIRAITVKVSRTCGLADALVGNSPNITHRSARQLSARRYSAKSNCASEFFSHYSYYWTCPFAGPQPT